MDSPAAIIGLIVIALVIVGGAAMAQIAYEDTGKLETFSEDFNTSNVSELVTFAESNKAGVFYQDSVNVTNENGTQMIDGQDYEWYDRNGTLEVLSQDLANNTDAHINYGYRVPSENQNQMAGFLASLFQAGYAIPLLFILILVIIAGGAIGGLS